MESCETLSRSLVYYPTPYIQIHFVSDNGESFRCVIQHTNQHYHIGNGVTLPCFDQISDTKIHFIVAEIVNILKAETYRTGRSSMYSLQASGIVIPPYGHTLAMFDSPTLSFFCEHRRTVKDRRKTRDAQHPNGRNLWTHKDYAGLAITLMAQLDALKLWSTLTDNMCAFCHHVPTASEKGMLRCGACRFARYCNPVCQHADWREHKQFCHIFGKMTPIVNLECKRQSSTVASEKEGHLTHCPATAPINTQTPPQTAARGNKMSTSVPLDNIVPTVPSGDPEYNTREVDGVQMGTDFEGSSNRRINDDQYHPAASVLTNSFIAPGAPSPGNVPHSTLFDIINVVD